MPVSLAFTMVGSGMSVAVICGFAECTGGSVVSAPDAWTDAARPDAGDASAMHDGATTDARVDAHVADASRPDARPDAPTDAPTDAPPDIDLG